MSGSQQMWLKSMTNAPQLTSQEVSKASECECGIQREMKQGQNQYGKVWRGEFCVLNECPVLWWRYNEQIELWIAPLYEPNDYVYLGLKGSPWEHLDPQPKEEEDDRTNNVELLSTEGTSLRS